MAAFRDAIGVVLQNEGGYVNDADDPGGETNFGISKRSFPDVDIKKLTKTDAADIYLEEYWKAYPRLEAITSQEVATKTLDLMVNMGSSRGIRILQLAVNHEAKGVRPIPIDGHLGPMTVARTNELDAQQVLQWMRYYAAQHYIAIVRKKPSQHKYLRGWLRRANQ